jgi:hypothetical protein
MKVTVNKPNLAPDTEVEVPGLGVFKNGTTTEIEAEGEDRLIGVPLEEKAQAFTKPAEVPQTPVVTEPTKEGE